MLDLIEPTAEHIQKIDRGDVLRDRALYNAKVDKNAATPMDPQPRLETEKLNRLYNSIKNAIGSKFPEVSKIDVVYLFDDEEAERLQIDGQCCRFKDNTTAIGICVEILHEREYVTMVLLHEMAHLRGWSHTKKFHEHLDNMIDTYNTATGSNIENDYYGLDEKQRNDGRTRLH